MFDFVRAGGYFLIGFPCTLRDLDNAITSPRLDITSSRPHAYTSIRVCETWVPMGPYRPGSQPSPTSEPDLREDLPTCQWSLPDLTYRPKNMKTIWCARQDIPAQISFSYCNQIG
jgi:hypothetical protein